jgi:5,10-methylenetetrahydrofolate reductase
MGKNLKHKILDPGVPVTFFEMVPPAADKPGSIEYALEEVRRVRHLVDAINLPEIHDESRGSPRAVKFVPRLEPRALGERLRRELDVEVVLNRAVVYESDSMSWFYQTHGQYGVDHVILVGGESSQTKYPGPNVLEAAEQVRAAGLPISLGGISIPSRLQEAERVRRKNSAGLCFFTTQVLFDSNDIVWLIQRLNGVEARIFLSFAPVSHPRDLEFLRWLGSDIPPDLDKFLLRGHAATEGSPAARESCFERSLNLAQRILMDVFDNMPPDPPPLGLNIEHINQRNLAGALRMVERLGELYTNLVAAKARA